MLSASERWGKPPPELVLAALSERRGKPPPELALADDHHPDDHWWGKPPPELALATLELATYPPDHE